MFAYDIYVCYSSDDRPRVVSLAESLRQAGLRVWFDEWEILPGDDIYLKVEAGLQAARTLLMCITPRALASQWVQMERATTLFRDPRNAGRTFVPVLLERCDLPEPLARLKNFDLTRHDRQRVDALVAVLRRILGAEPPAPPPEDGEPAATTDGAPATAAPTTPATPAAEPETVLYERGMTRALLATTATHGKVVHKHLTGLPDESRRLLRCPDYAEIVGTRLVAPPHVPDDGPIEVQLRYVPGWSLDDLVTAHNTLKGALLDDVVCAVLHQLRTAHRLGVVHRDVTPGNVVLGVEPLADDARRGRVTVQLIDFESACRTGQPQTPFGVFGYTPNEQIDGRAVPSSDLFALLGTAWFAATGRRPSASRWNDAERGRALRDITWGVFTELEQLGHTEFAKSWAEDPAARPADANALFTADDLGSRTFPDAVDYGAFELGGGWRVRMHNHRHVAERS